MLLAVTLLERQVLHFTLENKGFSVMVPTNIVLNRLGDVLLDLGDFEFVLAHYLYTIRRSFVGVVKHF